MPIYEYECIKCGEKFEQLRHIDDSDSDSEIKCPKCTAEHPRRIFSAFAMGSSSQSCAPSSPT